jgi:hypothetical protein
MSCESGGIDLVVAGKHAVGVLCGMSTRQGCAWATKNEWGQRREENMSAVACGLICAAMLAVGFGFVIPVSSIVTALCDFLAIGSGIAFIALLDGN